MEGRAGRIEDIIGRKKEREKEGRSRVERGMMGRKETGEKKDIWKKGKLKRKGEMAT